MGRASRGLDPPPRRRDSPHRFRQQPGCQSGSPRSPGSRWCRPSFASFASKAQDVAGIPLPLTEYGGAVRGLARWQAHHRSTKQGWLSQGWIPAHLRRRHFDNNETLAHPGWTRLIDLGLDPDVREAVRHRITDPVLAAAVLDTLPQLLTHYDFHHMNLGQDNRPGRDHRLVDRRLGAGRTRRGLLAHRPRQRPRRVDSQRVDDLTGTYATALQTAGFDHSATDIYRSVAVSNVIRQSWIIDHFLAISATVADQQIAAAVPLLNWLADLQATHLPEI